MGNNIILQYTALFEAYYIGAILRIGLGPDLTYAMTSLLSNALDRMFAMVHTLLALSAHRKGIDQVQEPEY